MRLPDLVARLRIDTADLSSAAARASSQMRDVSNRATAALGDLPDRMRTAGDQAGRNLAAGVAAGARTIERDAAGLGRRARDAFSRGIGSGGGGRGPFDYLLNSADATERRFNALGQALTRIGVGAGLGALVSQAVALTAALALALNIILALPGALATATAGIATLLIGFNGIGEALKASAKVGGGAARDTIGAQRAVESAVRGVESANHAAERAVKDVADAQRDVVLAQRGVTEALRRIADAQQAVADATLEVERAQIRALRAQEELNDAYTDAARRLRDYQTQLAGASQDVERADIARTDAIRRLNYYIAGGVQDERTLREARLAVAEAETRYQEAINRSTDLQQDANKALQAGLEGDEAVMRARESLTSATEGVGQASRDLADAQESVTDANYALEDANYAVAQSQDALTESNYQLRQAQLDIIDANNRLADAQAAAAAGALGGAAAIDKAAEAMAKLSPNAQALVRTILGLRDEWEALTKTVQNRLFEGVAGDLDGLARSSFPTLERGLGQVAGALNSVFRDFLRVSSTPLFQDNIAQIFRITADAINQLGTATQPLTIGLSNLAVAAEPVIRRLSTAAGEALRGAGAFLSTEEGANKMATKMNRALDILSQVWDITKNLGLSLSAMFKASEGAGLLDRLEEGTRRLQEFLNSAEGQEKLTRIFTFFGDVAEKIATNVIPFLFNGLNLLISAIERMPKPVQDGITNFLAFSLAIGPILRTLALFTVGLKGFLDALQFLSGLRVLSGVFTALGGVIRVVAVGIINFAPKMLQAFKLIATGIRIASLAILGNPIVLAITAIVAAVAVLAVVIYKNWDTIKNATIVAFNAVKDAIGAAWDWISSKVSGAVNAVRDHITERFNATVSFLAGINQSIRDAIGSAWDWVWDKITTVVGWIWDRITSGFNAVVNVVVDVSTRIWDAIRSAWDWVGDKTREVFGKLRDWISSGLDAALSFVTGFPDRVARGLGNLFDIGKNAIQGLLDGMNSLLKDIGKFMADKLPGALQDPFKKALDIKSPSGVFAAYGRNIGEGLVRGIDASAGKVRKAMGGLSSTAQGAFRVSVPAISGTSALQYSGYGGGGYATTGGSSVEYHAHFDTVPYTPAQVADEAMGALRRMERRYGA